KLELGHQPSRTADPPLHPPAEQAIPRAEIGAQPEGRSQSKAQFPGFEQSIRRTQALEDLELLQMKRSRPNLRYARYILFTDSTQYSAKSPRDLARSATRPNAYHPTTK